MPQHAVMLLAALYLASAPTPPPKPDKEEWKRLNGTWEVVNVVTDGVTTWPSRRGPAITMMFKDGKYAVKTNNENDAEGAAKVAPRDSPRSLDITPATGPNKGKTFLGIYEFRGDTLRLCFALPGKPRPKAFQSKEGSGHILITHKRAKP